MGIEIDYQKYYDLETYLFNEVAKSYENRHYLNTEEFFCIVIWKANRAKSKIAKKFTGSLEEGVKELTTAIYRSFDKSDLSKAMEVLIKRGYYLPMASAILSVLYQNHYSVYDIRVCDILRKQEKGEDKNKYHKIQNKGFKNLWFGYEEYLSKVLEVSGKSTYREADRYLWGKSFYKQLKIDIRSKFKKG